MQVYSGALPVLPGKRDALMQFIKDIQGPMKKDYEKSQKRLGIKKVAWFLQSPNGGDSGDGNDSLLMYLEAELMTRVFGDFAVSKEPFDVLMRNTMKEITGFDFSMPPKGPPPALLNSYGY
jgi:hypothetical protein